MRAILFKGMTIDRHWVYGNLSILTKDLSRSSGYNVKAGYYISSRVGEPFAYQVRPETVGQFIEVCDCKGKDIFDGDIVRPPNYRETGNKNDKVIVEINNGNVMSWTTQTNKYKHETVDFWQRCEVIGNIHDERQKVFPTKEL